MMIYNAPAVSVQSSVDRDEMIEHTTLIHLYCPLPTNFAGNSLDPQSQDQTPSIAETSW